MIRNQNGKSSIIRKKEEKLFIAWKENFVFRSQNISKAQRVILFYFLPKLFTFDVIKFSWNKWIFQFSYLFYFIFSLSYFLFLWNVNPKKYVQVNNFVKQVKLHKHKQFETEIIFCVFLLEENVKSRCTAEDFFNRHFMRCPWPKRSKTS